MGTQALFNDNILLLLQALLLLIGFFAKKTLNNIELNQKTMIAELKITNGRVTKIEAKIVAHDKQDDDRHKESLDKFHDIFSVLNKK